MKTIRNIFAVLGGLTLLGIGAVVFIMLVSNLFGAQNTITVQPEIGSNPMIGNGDPYVWNKPMEDGQMTTEGRVTYTQTGKPGEQTVTGYIAEGQTLVYTAYRVVLTTGDIANNGVVGIIEGPFDLDRYPLTLVDGAATLVASGEATQAKLDSMWVDFCRGDRTADGKAWTYRHWALSHVFLPDWYYFLGMSDCMNASNDSWPNNPPSSAGYESTTTDSADNATSASYGERTPTGEGNTLRFPAGATVCGTTISLDNGEDYTGCISNAPTGGSVFTGVIWPWDTELHDVINLDR